MILLNNRIFVEHLEVLSFGHKKVIDNNLFKDKFYFSFFYFTIFSCLLSPA